MPGRRSARDLSKLSGEPLTKTIEPSILSIGSQGWLTSRDLREDGLPFRPEAVYQMAIFLMANPNLTSSLLFRADILSDSEDVLETSHGSGELIGRPDGSETRPPPVSAKPMPAVEVEGFDMFRTVLTRLIPRKQNVDKALEQTCHFYVSQNSTLNLQGAFQQEHNIESSGLQRVLVMHSPHVTSPEEMPFYYPMLRSFAYLYEFQVGLTDSNTTGTGTMSLHFLPFSTDIPNRLERTLHKLLDETVRLSRNWRLNAPQDESNVASGTPYKDNIIPRSLVQNTYARIKSVYARDLCHRWTEKTEPSKHVFEDLMIAAFLVELWRSMYGVTPPRENESQSRIGAANFPGFVDVACGNGVLVYVLLMEGYQGCGFDARRRKTWDIFPGWVREKLMERVYIPKPFADVIKVETIEVDTHIGDFPSGTFIISNHADELTVWTPLMAALACPASPLPFLAIPCCSHSLSGARDRYPPPKKGGENKRLKNNTATADEQDEQVEQTSQPATGDLRALRAAKDHGQTANGTLNSTYGSLTAKTVAIAAEAGYEVEQTKLRIPSTRDMGIVGGRQPVTNQCKRSPTTLGLAPTSAEEAKGKELFQKIMHIVDRECAREGGIQASARVWVERVRKLHHVHGNRRYPDDS